MSLPSEEQHLRQARRAYECYEHLVNDGQFLEWAVTALFYAALHLVLAHATREGHTLSEDHTAIRRYLDRHLTSIQSTYRTLFDASRDTRYRCVLPDVARVQRLHDGPFQQIVGQLRRRGISL